jgi:IclR family transcriptional regulator, KDG regulon repressor
MKQPPKETLRHVEAVLSALSLLDCFVTKPVLNVKELIEMTGLTRNRVMRLCGTLKKKGYLVQDLEAKNFSLGYQVMILGKAFEKSNNLTTAARPILKELVQNTGESASLYVLEGNKRLVLVREEGTQVIRHSVTEGQRFPIHAGASGKTLLAFSPEEVTRKLISDRKLASLTPYTVTDPVTLKAELAKIRFAGYAFSQSERAMDAASIACPVFDHENRLVGAISIGGPVTRFTSDRRPGFVEQVMKAAEKLSTRLGWKKGDEVRKHRMRGE